MRIKGFPLFCSFLVVLSSLRCSPPKDKARQEDIINLRAIGVSVTPSLSMVAQSLSFVFYAVTPKGQSVIFSTYTDPSMRHPLKPPILPTTETVLSRGALDVHQISGSYAIESPLPIPVDPGFVSYDYGLRLTAAGKQESLMGTFVLFGPSNPAYAWQPHSVSITNLKEGQIITGQNVDLAAAIVGGNKENYRIGWFTSSGTIDNRRAIQTSITSMNTGVQTIIVTARGMLTGIFAMAMVDVTVQ